MGSSQPSTTKTTWEPSRDAGRIDRASPLHAPWHREPRSEVCSQAVGEQAEKLLTIGRGMDEDGTSARVAGFGERLADDLDFPSPASAKNVVSRWPRSIE